MPVNIITMEEEPLSSESLKGNPAPLVPTGGNPAPLVPTGGNPRTPKREETISPAELREYYFEKLEIIEALTEGNFLITLGDISSGKSAIQNAILSRLKRYPTFKYCPKEIEITEDDIKDHEKHQLELLNSPEKEELVELRKSDKDKREKDALLLLQVQDKSNEKVNKLTDKQKDKLEKQRIEIEITKLQTQIQTNKKAIFNHLISDMRKKYLPNRTQGGEIEKFEISFKNLYLDILEVSGEDIEKIVPKYNQIMELSENLNAYIINKQIEKTFILVADSNPLTLKDGADQRLEYLLEEKIIPSANGKKIKIMLIASKWDEGNKDNKTNLKEFLIEYFPETIRILDETENITQQYMTFEINGVHEVKEIERNRKIPRFKYEEIDQEGLEYLIQWIYNSYRPDPDPNPKPQSIGDRFLNRIRKYK